PSRFHDQPHISTRQYARIVHRWVERAGLEQLGLRDPLDAADQGRADLQEDRQSEGGSALAWAHKARKHRPLSWYRGRRRAQHLRASGTLNQTRWVALPLAGRSRPFRCIGKAVRLGGNLFDKAWGNA